MITLDSPGPKLTLSRVLERVDDIPPMPAVASKAMGLIDDPKSNVRDLAEAISLDPALASRVMRIANSAYYGVPRRVTSLQGAVVRVGFDVVKSIVLLISAYGLMQKPLRGYGLSGGELWRHSVACAFAARLLAQLKGYEYAEEAYICGLLHDVGKIVLDPMLPASLVKSFAEALAQGEPPFEVEAALLGFDHAVLGGLVAERWSLPPQTAEAIRCHHQPSAAEVNPILAYIVCVANMLAATLSSGTVGLPIANESYQAALAALELPPDVTELLIEDLASQVSNAELFLALGA